MNKVSLLHAPQWTLVGTQWHLIVGNRSVAKLIPNSDRTFPQYHWLSVIEYEEYPDHGWHAVDFETLEIAKHDLEQWWAHMCKGEAYRPPD
jgi:hypothetical protein